MSRAMRHFIIIAAAFLASVPASAAIPDSTGTVDNGIRLFHADSLAPAAPEQDSTAADTLGTGTSLAVADSFIAGDGDRTKADKKKSRRAGKGAWDRKKVRNIAYSMQTLAPDFGNEINGKFGVALVSGRSIYLHKSPIAGMIKFSIDLGADINYAQYLPAEGDYNMDSSLTEDVGIGISGRHHLDIGMFLGPAVSVNPVGDLMVTAYFRFVPSYSAFLMDVDAYHGFTPFLTYGGEVTWKWIGLGVEGRSGYGSYSSIMSLFNGGESMKVGYATQAVRCYISFRF